MLTQLLVKRSKVDLTSTKRMRRPSRFRLMKHPTDAELETLAAVFGIELGEGGVTLPKQLRRQTDFMTQEPFNTHHSETEMMRYYEKLSDRDLALDRAMIPLGSCTMKLNAASEMAPITWPEFANIHPFAPDSQRLGYQEMIQNLNDWLAEITDYAGYFTAAKLRCTR